MQQLVSAFKIARITMADDVVIVKGINDAGGKIIAAQLFINTLINIPVIINC
jgi:hypothetical protein